MNKLIKSLSTLVLTTSIITSTWAAELPTTQILFTNVNVFDGVNEKLKNNMNVLVEGNLIKSISSKTIKTNRAVTIINGKGKTLMPGLIDMHTHLMYSKGVAVMRTDYDAQASGALAMSVLDRYMNMGYTTVRDVGGNSLGIAKHLKEGNLKGPRVYSSGGAITPISGHNDIAMYSEKPKEDVFSKRGDANVITGPIEARAAVRTLMRYGASQIKIMVGGGVASDFDPLHADTMAEDEIKAIVDAAADFGTYACAHAYTDTSVNRVLDAGGRCIEHGFLITEKTVKRMKKLGAVMSLQPYAAVEIFKAPEKLAGFGPENIKKGRQVRDGAENMLKLIAKHKVDTFAGADLWQDGIIEKTAEDMVLRKRWFSNIEVLRQNTSSAAKWLAKSGTKNPYKLGPLGVIKQGAYADLLLVDGNPVKDVAIVADFKKNIKVIVKDGEFYKNIL